MQQQLVFIKRNFGHVSRWSHSWQIQHLGPAPVLQLTDTLGRISRFARVSGEARAGHCLKCKSTGPGEEKISFWKVLSLLVDAGQGTERVPFCKQRKSQI